jgi:hypothetical protein
MVYSTFVFNIVLYEILRALFLWKSIGLINHLVGFVSLLGLQLGTKF